MDGLVALLQVRARTVDDLALQAVPFVRDELEFEEKAVAKHWARDPDAAEERMSRLLAVLEESEWAEEPLEAELRALAGEMGIGAGKVIHPLRVALTGRTASPGIFEVLVMLGRERSLARLRDGIRRVRELPPARS
jgi:glutamyl-tRNA synthetase